MKIFITDDHSVIFEGFKSLSKYYGFQIVGTATKGADLLKWLEHNTCDVIVLDLRMPIMSGIEVLKILSEKENVPNILVLSAYADIAKIQEAILLGAKGFVLKTEIHNCMEEAIRKVGTGKKYFSETILDQVIIKQLETQKKVTIKDILSEKEAEALAYMTENIETKDICEEMNITKSSFYTITERMRLKLGVKKNLGLVILALKHGFKRKK